MFKNIKILFRKPQHKNLVKPHRKIQIDFAGPIYHTKNEENYILLCIDRYAFKNFCENRNFKTFYVPVDDRKAIGLVERAMKSVKECVKISDGPKLAL